MASKKNKISAYSIDVLYECSPKKLWNNFKLESAGFKCVCIYMFFEYVRPQSIYTWLDFFPWNAFFASMALILSFSDKKNISRGSSLNKLIVLYAIIVFLSCLFAISKSHSFNNIDYYYNWVVIYFAIVLNVNTRQRFFIFLILYILWNFKMTQHGFISWATRGFSFATWGVTGAPGYFQNSGEFGIQLSIFVPLIITFIIALKSKWNKLCKIFFYLIPFTGIGSTIATSSRGALVGLVIAGIWLSKSSQYFIRSIVILAVVISLAWHFTPAEFKSRFDTAGEDKTSTHRLDRWKSAWETMKKYPALGVGHKNWEIYYQYHHQGARQAGSLMLHNIFLESGTEHGFLGLSVLIMIILSILFTNYKIKKHSKDNYHFEYWISQGLNAGTIGMIISCSFVTVLYYPYVWIQAALTTCLYQSIMTKNSKK